MTKNERIQKIKEVVFDIGSTTLSKECGKYYNIYGDKDGVWVNSFIGENGYDVTLLDILPSTVITKIYNDLKADFRA